MASAKKHMQRSHRSYHNQKPFAHFEAKAKIKQSTKESKGFFKKLFSKFHRKTNK